VYSRYTTRNRRAPGRKPSCNSDSPDAFVRCEPRARPGALPCPPRSREPPAPPGLSVILGRPTDRAATLSILADQPLEALVEFSTANFSSAPPTTFRTAPAPATPFTFTVQGDSHPERPGKMFDAALDRRALANAAVVDRYDLPAAP
jgi:hypothetical protein